MQDTIWKPKEKGKGSPCLTSRYPFFHSPVLNFKKTTENFLVRGSGGTDTYVFSLVTNDRTRVNGLRLYQGSFSVLDWVLHSEGCWVLGWAPQGSGHSMKSESKKFLDNTLRHTRIILCGTRNWTQRFLWVPYNAETSVILWHCACGLRTCHSAYTSNIFFSFLLFPSSYLPSLPLFSTPQFQLSPSGTKIHKSPYTGH